MRTRMTPTQTRARWVLVGILAGSQLVSGQQLAVQGRQLLVDGDARFLTFISYFGGMGAADVDADLRFVKRAGFDGIRLWPNAPDGPVLMKAAGGLRPEGL